MLEKETFQLTTSRRGRRDMDGSESNLTENFNSLPHAEVDRAFLVATARGKYFNSLPHAEVDRVLKPYGTLIFISTHYLTQR